MQTLVRSFTFDSNAVCAVDYIISREMREISRECRN